MIGPNSRYGLLDNPIKFIDSNAPHPRWVGTRVPVVLPVADDDHYLVIRPAERPDQLAARVPGWKEAFGDDAGGLYFVIFDQPDNAIQNPLALPAGRKVRCPSADRVADLLSR